MPISYAHWIGVLPWRRIISRTSLTLCATCTVKGRPHPRRTADRNHWRDASVRRHSPGRESCASRSSHTPRSSHPRGLKYVRDHLILRTEPTTNNVTDYGVNKAIDHLPALRDKMAATINNYLDVQQDILEAFVDRGQLRNLAQPTLTATGKRIPGLKLDNPRQLALMHALVRFAQIPAARTFSP